MASTKQLPPGWAADERASITAEAARYVDMTPAERAVHLKAVCRAGMRLLRSREDWREVLHRRDPLPPSTVAALRRLQGRRE